MLELNTGSKTFEVKFNLKALMKVNSEFSNIENGKSNDDGASVAYVQLLTGNDKTLVDVIKLCANPKVSESEVEQAIENYVEENSDNEEAYKEFFNLIIEEFKNSRFFGKKAKDIQAQMTKQKEMILAQDPQTEKSKEKLDSMEYILTLMKQEK